MHKIIWDFDSISMLTNSIDTTMHKHWMLQLFFRPEGTLNLNVEGEAVSGICVIVNTNCSHTFCTSEELHFSMLITPGTALSEYLVHTYIKDAVYYDFSRFIDQEVADTYEQFIRNPDLERYLRFRNILFKTWGVQPSVLCSEMDDRIKQLLQSVTMDAVKTVDLNSEQILLSVDGLSEMVHLSPSRLAHLFKEETGVPLKSYLVLTKVFRTFQMLFSGSSITEAALNAGFDSPSHMAATVKGMMGTSSSLAMKDSEFLKVPFESTLYNKLSQ